MNIDPKIILIGLVLFFGYKHRDDIKIPMGGFGDTKEVIQVVTKDRQIPVVKPELQSMVQKLTDSLKSGPNNGRDRIKDATVLGDLYGDFALIVVKPNDAIKTNADLRNVLNKYLTLHNSNYMNLKKEDYNDIASQVNQIMISYLGSEPQHIDVNKTVDVLTSIQGAFYASRL